MTLRYTPRAIQHLEKIAAFISETSPSAARRVGKTLQSVVTILEEFPRIGREGVLLGTRELVVRNLPYIIVYRLEDDGAVAILGVYHGAQLRPGQDEPK